ncbi:MAG: hypothetical protein GWN84_18950 [Gammaproteobacteria bacterium]|nr:hypothetical protein [Gammaproteobacteria bacterium]NIR84905.1 hypothetical protein [Gammaproteobacteria bacterium]NIR91754.1 hypothetical protein [Gammaproteobacteria bacterium]NIU05952.1 hypothetical protein [Gammaproteobacteria bacterium]NIV52999.1 hypothetical protein [Gammaproteobacteria bacterium]
MQDEANDMFTGCVVSRGVLRRGSSAAVSFRFSDLGDDYTYPIMTGFEDTQAAYKDIGGSEPRI